MNLMKRQIIVIALFVLCFGAVNADYFRPRTIDEKVQASELIVLGTATVFGDKIPPPRPGDIMPAQYERNLRIDVKKVFWPSSLKNEREITFRFSISESWPKSWWDYTNTPGVFFLTKNTNPANGQWDKLYRFDDWMEPNTHVLAVLFAIEKQKGTNALTGNLQIPKVSYPLTTRYDSDQKLRWVFLSSYRDGFQDALVDKHSILMFGPTNDEDKAKVLGFADGQLAGDAARKAWIAKLLK